MVESSSLNDFSVGLDSPLGVISSWLPFMVILDILLELASLTTWENGTSLSWLGWLKAV